MTLLLTVITAAYNAQKYLQRLIDNLAGQSFRDFEWIVQDALSADKTLSILERARGRIPRLVLHSEHDTGIYDAWNKAMGHARGDWCIFLGADDYFPAPDTLEKVSRTLRNATTEQWFVTGHLNIVAKNGVEMYRLDDYESRKLYAGGMPAPFPALFIRREILLAHPFDTSFRIAGDHHFLMRTWKKSRAVFLPFVITNMTIGGISNVHTELRLKESGRIMREAFPVRYRVHCVLEKFAKYKKELYSSFISFCKKIPGLQWVWNWIKRVRCTIKKYI